MAYRFQPDDKTIIKGAQRIAHGQIDAALALLVADTPPSPQTVHALRKHTKKLRGLLRLLAPVMKGYSRENTRLRNAARQIAPLRDAEVRLGTFDLLTRELAESPGLKDLRAMLEQDLASARQPEQLAAICAVMRTELEAARASLGALVLRKPYMQAGTRKASRAGAFDVLRPGLETSWRRAQAGLEAAREALAGDFPAEPFHEWRKAAKHHWYQARLLQPVWPEAMATHIATADTLGETLGDHNDLDVLCSNLQARVTAEGCTSGAAALPALHAAALRPRRLLAEQAVALGSMLFAPPARAITDQWGAWWAAWKGAPTSSGKP